MKVMLGEILIFAMIIIYDYYLVLVDNNEPFRVALSTSSG